MLISKTKTLITKNYDELLVDPDLTGLVKEIRRSLVETQQVVIDVSGTQDTSGPYMHVMWASLTI